MTYATSRLTCVHHNTAQSTWVLDTVDTIATVNTAGFISDGGSVATGGKGMVKGDLVYVNIWTTAIPVANSEVISAAGVANVLTAKYICVVLGVSTAGAVDLTDGLAITITNTD